MPAGSNGSGLSGDYFFWSEQAEDDFRQEHNMTGFDPELDRVASGDGRTGEQGAGAASEEPSRHRVIRRELHEVKELERLFGELGELGLSIEDYLLQQEEQVTGEMGPTRFELRTVDLKGKPHHQPVVNLANLVSTILDAGKEGMGIKRFKGLGEMDPEQLWETTMNPANRVLLRVTWDAASEAEQLFSILMGEDVEPRRRYIEQHALEVKNLDV